MSGRRGTRANPILALFVRFLDLDVVEDIETGETRIVIHYEIESSGDFDSLGITVADAREFGRRLIEAADEEEDTGA
jgi:hypothetical protein